MEQTYTFLSNNILKLIQYTISNIGHFHPFYRQRNPNDVSQSQRHKDAPKTGIGIYKFFKNPSFNSQ